MIGHEIKLERMNKGLSQEKLAEKAGVHRTYISLIERNIKSPTIDIFIRICNGLNIKPSTILKRTGQ